MLNHIKTSAEKDARQEAVELLLACHQKIRHFSGVAVKLSHAQGVAPQEIVQAADGLHRYFTVALPLHEADENLSLHPRLRAVSAQDEMAAAAADAMVEQHLAIDELVERLLPLWVVVRSNPGKLDEVSGEMCQLTARLQEAFDAHLRLEEETVFPAMERLLSEPELAGLVAEMKGRRGL